MLFNSIDFLIFFPIVVLVYYLIPNRIRHYWLLLASYYFYMSWNAKYVFLILFSTVVTYLCGILLDRVQHGTGSSDAEKKKRKKWIVALSFLLSLGLLCYFKYTNFLLESAENVLGVFHLRMKLPRFDILLPVGISFFTFQALGYTVDVYRGDIEAERDFFRYALFVSFFPQLVAGPIERSRNLMKQLAVPQKFRYERAKEGLFLMLWGYFLKIVVADRIAAFVDPVYGNVLSYNGWYLLFTTVLFAFQIYCDFSAYSVIAMGAAKILGISLMENFDAPYLSCSVAEFWRKWHISLTSWFKDYLYIPLGGSRKGTFRKYLNKLIVFLVSGLWHGASITFVVWGGINGIFQIIGEALDPLREKVSAFCGLHRESFAHRCVRSLVTFALVDFAWIFFRANSMQDALWIIRRILSPGNPSSLITDLLNSPSPRELVSSIVLLLFCLLLLFFADLMKHRGIVLRKVILAQDSWFQALVFVFAVCGILLFGIWGPGYQEASFIYFQF